LNTFKAGQVPFLIATDVAARGIDIPNINYVLNYDLPDNIDDYIHRVGRTVIFLIQEENTSSSNWIIVLGNLTLNHHHHSLLVKGRTVWNGKVFFQRRKCTNREGSGKSFEGKRARGARVASGCCNGKVPK